MILHSDLYNEKSDLIKVLDSLKTDQKIELALYCTRSIFYLNQKELPSDIFNLVDKWLETEDIDVLKNLNHLLTVYSFEYFTKNGHITNELDVLSNTIRFILCVYNVNISNIKSPLVMDMGDRPKYEIHIADIVWAAASFSREITKTSFFTPETSDEAKERLLEFKNIAISYLSKSNNNKYSGFIKDRDINSILVLLDNMEDNDDNELYIFKDNKWYFNIPYLNICNNKLDNLKIRIRNIIRQDNELSYRIVNYIRNLYKYNNEEDQ